MKLSQIGVLAAGFFVVLSLLAFQNCGQGLQSTNPSTQEALQGSPSLSPTPNPSPSPGPGPSPAPQPDPNPPQWITTSVANSCLLSISADRVAAGGAIDINYSTSYSNQAIFGAGPVALTIMQTGVGLVKTIESSGQVLRNLQGTAHVSLAGIPPGSYKVFLGGTRMTVNATCTIAIQIQ